jgi:hypothetical protein
MGFLGLRAKKSPKWLGLVWGVMLGQLLHGFCGNHNACQDDGLGQKNGTN